MIFFIQTTKHLDIRRDMKKISPVGCCIDKRKKSRGTVKIRFTGGSKENTYVFNIDCFHLSHL